VTHGNFSEKSQNFPITPVILPPPPKKGFPLELGTGAGDQKCEWWAIGPKRSLIITSTSVTDGWTDRRTNGHGTTAKTVLMC